VFIFTGVIVIKNYVDMNKIIKKTQKEIDEQLSWIFMGDINSLSRSARIFGT